MQTDSGSGSGAAAAPAAAGKKTRVAKAAKTSAPKVVLETPAEALIHEILRLANVDLRSSPFGVGLAKQLGDLIHKK